MTHDEKLIDAIVTLVAHPAGLGIELFMIIGIARMENGKYAVGGDFINGEKIEERLFDDPRDAAIFFLDLREKYKVGFDFEVGTN